ncbi:MAG: RimK family protein [Planctomycetes bacterium]|nr:RimK family protein [Planctomycetota bacterium]
MHVIIVVDNPRDWPFRVAGVEVASADRYLSHPDYAEIKGARIFNLCRSYRYQGTGYYVSLLAEARGHRPMPSVAALQDMKNRAVLRIVSEDLDELIQQSLDGIRTSPFDLSVYFGRNMAARHDRLSLRLFNLIPVPLLRARFRLRERWQLQSIQVIPGGAVPETHRDFVADTAASYFAGRRPRARTPARQRYDLAILHNEAEEEPPSDRKALRKFMHAAERVGLGPTLVTRDDYARLGEFDALFIRETTAVDHHTYRFAQRAAAEGMVVIDDPRSISRCTNKIFLAEAAERFGLPVPRTVIIGQDDPGVVLETVGLPCVLKIPDSSFSRGVIKVESADELAASIERFRKGSDLVLAQEFLPTEFDWRVGLLGGKPLYVCKYFMAQDHWQIIRRAGTRTFAGKVQTLAVEDAPARVVQTALRAARPFGDGLYGVDLKQVGRQVFVIEVNDNPSIDAGYEDAVLKDALYDAIMQAFVDRLDARRKNGNPR